ncbi:MAG: hypothetical protein WCC38_14565 [Pseudonocardiaceae bacterium]
MDYPDRPAAQVIQFQPSSHRPDQLLIELHEAQRALAIAEYHIRSWRAQFAATEEIHIRPRVSCVAHQALHEAGRAIDDIAALLKIQAHGTRATRQGNSAQIYLGASPADAHGEPTRQPSVEFA